MGNFCERLLLLEINFSPATQHIKTVLLFVDLVNMFPVATVLFTGVQTVPTTKQIGTAKNIAKVEQMR